MALKVWLPLNGNINNNGLTENNASINGSVPFSNGKIGKAADFTSTSATNRITVPGLELTTFSVCAWFMSPSAVSTASCIINEGRDYNTYGWRMYITSANKISLNCANTAFNTMDCVVNTWYHACITIGNGIVKYYINGELKSSVSTTALPDYSESNGFINVGAFGYSTNNTFIYPFNGYINDVRIYDEVLSDKQIKEIAKGLCAHYKLEGIGANPNLIRMGGLVNSGATSVNYDNSTDTYTIVSPVGTSVWGYGVNIGSTNKVVIPYNQKYRMSCEVWVPTEHKLVVDYNNYSNDSTVASWGGNDNDLGSQRLANSVIIPANTWTKVVMGSMNAHASNTTQTAIYEASKYGLYTNDDTEPTTWYLRHFKVELGDKVTGWIPNIADAAYTELGYDKALTTDVSGFGYNGTVTGELTFDVDSPRYVGSTKFNGSSYMTTTPGSLSWCNFDNLTISTWMKPTVKPGGWTGSIGIQQDGGTSGKVFSISNYAGNFSVHTDNGSGWVTTQSETLPLNQWSHCVATLTDGINLKMYINGELVKTATINYNTATVLSDTRIAIGVDLPGDDEKYTGFYSDVRFYSTALSAEDILKLYEISGIIDNKGNTYSYEFIEED